MPHQAKGREPQTGEIAARGRFFEDFQLGETIVHAIPRTVTDGDRALITALYLNPFALTSSDAFARQCGLPQAPTDTLSVFHIVFGKSVPDISRNAVANLGYAECRFLRPVYSGDDLRASSEVVGLRQTRNGRTGIVYVRTGGFDHLGRKVVEFCRWVMVNKRNADAPAPDPVTPKFQSAVAPEELVLPEGLRADNYDCDLAGSARRWGDYDTGERIDHVDGVTIEEAEHHLATRLWQNNARVHFDQGLAEAGRFARRIVYGGHVISIARALSYNGLQNAQFVAAINGGTHAAPCFAGDTVHAWSEVLARNETENPGFGALRLRTVACKNRSAAAFPLRGPEGMFEDGVVLDIDWWVVMPR